MPIFLLYCIIIIEGDNVKKRTKVIMIIISILILVIALSIIIMTFLNGQKMVEEEKNITTIVNTKNNFITEVYSKVKLSELITIENGTLKNDFYINTSKIGEIEVKYSYFNNLKKETASSFKIKVLDTEKPYIGLGKSYTHVIGNNFNLESSVLCGDNYTKKPKCYIMGDYDLEKVGKYQLTFYAEDESGNKNSVNFTLNVVEKSPNISTTNTSISFEQIKARLPENASLMVDVSKWQQDIDWQKVHANGIEYAMLRIGTQKGVDKESIIDAYFEQNIKNAQAAGIKVGVYYYSYANDKNDVLEQAKWVVDTLKDYELDLPVAFDWECWSLFNSFNISFHDLNEIAETFLREIEKEGYQPLLYGSKNYMENIWNLDYDIWLAHYTEKTSYEGPRIMWQFTSSGKVPGISGNVDVNFYYNK